MNPAGVDRLAAALLQVLPADSIESTIDSHPVQPGRWLCRAVELEVFLLLEDLDANLLHDFLRRMVIAEDPQGDAIESGNVLRQSVPAQQFHGRFLNKVVPC